MWRGESRSPALQPACAWFAPAHGLEPRGDVRHTLRDLAGVRCRADLSAEQTVGHVARGMA
jgi:hypothetical protein